jgi:hypothetical protein
VISFSLKGETEIPGYRRIIFNDAFIARYVALF